MNNTVKGEYVSELKEVIQAAAKIIGVIDWTEFEAHLGDYHHTLTYTDPFWQFLTEDGLRHNTYKNTTPESLVKHMLKRYGQKGHYAYTTVTYKGEEITFEEFEKMLKQCL